MKRTKKRLPPNIHWNAKRGTYELVKRDKRLTGGRVSLSLRTADADEAIARRGDFLTLLDGGRRSVVEALRSGTVHWSDVRRAIRDGDYSELQTSLVPVPTLGEARDAIVADVKATRRKATAASYSNYLDQLVAHFGADTLLTELSTDDVRAWLRGPKNAPAGRRSTKGNPWSANTQAIVRTLGKRMFKMQIDRLAEMAEKQKTVPPIRKNPFQDVAAPMERGTRVEFLRPAEWRKLSEVCDGTPDHAIVALGTLAGLRIGEIANLRCDLDVDLEARVIRVQPREGEHKWKPKNLKRSVRTIPMSDELRRVLQFHREHFAGEVYFIIAAKRDQPLATATLRKYVERVFTAAGIRYGQKADALTAHSLRHTFASWLVQQDVQLLKVAKVLGDTAKQVEDTYAHLMPGDLGATATAIDKAANDGKRTPKVSTSASKNR